MRFCEWLGYDKQKDAIDTLVGRGWVFITISGIYNVGIHIEFTQDVLTEKQKECLQPFLEVFGKKLCNDSKMWLRHEFPDIDFCISDPLRI